MTITTDQRRDLAGHLERASAANQADGRPGGWWVNIGCGEFRAPDPWVNLDVWNEPPVRPDLVVDRHDDPLADFATGSVQRAYAGHVIEHVPWDDVRPWLGRIQAKLRPGGELMIVAPDVLRVIKRWKDGLDPEGWELVESVLENPWDRAHGEGYATIRQDPTWLYARHHWNCFEERVKFAFADAEGWASVESVPIEQAGELGRWPLVAYTQWQCAVRAVRSAG